MNIDIVIWRNVREVLENASASPAFSAVER